jgi:DNA adenine methylase
MLQQKHAEHSRSESEQYKYNHICYPFVKWAGGKTQLLRTLNRHIPPLSINILNHFWGEVQCSTISPQKIFDSDRICSDTNEDLINAYKIVKNKVEELILLLERHEKEFNKSHEEYYYELRAKPPRTAIERAARFIALNKTCYNGLYRVNGKGEFNVPIGRYRKPVIPCVLNNTN